MAENESHKNLDIKDLTGAGDLFAAGFTCYLNNMESLEVLTKAEKCLKLFNKSELDIAFPMLYPFLILQL